MSWLNSIAVLNMEFMLVTELVSDQVIGALELLPESPLLKLDALLNISCIDVTLLTSQALMF